MATTALANPADTLATVTQPMNLSWNTTTPATAGTRLRNGWHGEVP
jgi:hypothetical protein